MWISTLHNQFRQLQLNGQHAASREHRTDTGGVSGFVCFFLLMLLCCVHDFWCLNLLLNRELQAVIKDKSKALKIQNQKILQVYELIPSCLWVLHFQNHHPASPSTYVLSLKSMKTENRFTTLTCKCKPTKQSLTLLNHKNLANSWFYFSDNF